MSNENFRQEMRRWPQEHPMFQSVHPFWRAVFRGRVDKTALHRWGADVYPFVRDFPRFYLHVATKCESVAALTFLGETIYEETGSGKETEAHSNLFRRFLSELGLAEIPTVPVTPEGKAIWDFVGDVSRNGTFLEGLAAVGLGIERPLPSFFPMVARAMQKHYGSSESGVEFFTIHSVADVKHSQVAARLVAELAPTAEMQRRAREIVFHIWDLQQRHLDHLYSRSLLTKKNPALA